MSNASTPSDGNNGKAARPEVDQHREAFTMFQRMFAETFAKCYNANAENVTAMPLEQLVKSVKLGPASKTTGDVTVQMPRALAKMLKLAPDDPTKDLMVFVHITRAAVDDLSKPALVVGTDGKKLA